MYLAVKVKTVNLGHEGLFDLPRCSAEFDFAPAIRNLVNVQTLRLEPSNNDAHVFGRDSETFSKFFWCQPLVIVR